MSQGVEVSGQAVPSPLRLPIAPAGPPWTRRRRGLTVEDAVNNLSDRSESVKEVGVKRRSTGPEPRGSLLWVRRNVKVV